MSEASLDRKIDVAYGLMQRFDAGSLLSEVLPQFKTLAGLEGDETTQFLADLLIYGLTEVPDAKPPYVKPAQTRAVLLFMDLCEALDVDHTSIDSVLNRAFAGKTPDHNYVISTGVYAMEQAKEAPTLPPLVSRDLLEKSFQINVVYSEIRKALHKLRSYVYDYASKSWQKNLKEKQHIQLLGPDYRLVLDSVDALDSAVAAELTAALDNLFSENPANWGLAALGCRTVLLRLSAILWKASINQYQSVLLGKPLSLTGDVEKNKLCAYIDVHWGAASAEKKQLLRQAHDLVQPIYDTGSKGKIGSKFRHAEAQNLVVDTFRLVTLLQDATDLVPYSG